MRGANKIVHGNLKHMCTHSKRSITVIDHKWMHANNMNLSSHDHRMQNTIEDLSVIILTHWFSKFLML